MTGSYHFYSGREPWGWEAVVLHDQQMRRIPLVVEAGSVVRPRVGWVRLVEHQLDVHPQGRDEPLMDVCSRRVCLNATVNHSAPCGDG